MKILEKSLAPFIGDTFINSQNKDWNFFRPIFSVMGKGLFLLRVSDNVIVYTNPKFEIMFGFGPNELFGKHVSILYLASSAQYFESMVAEQLIESDESIFEKESIKKDGTIFWSRSCITKVDHPEFGLVWVSVLEDISLAKEAEKKARSLIIQGVLEDERARISRDLHDELGHDLTVLKMDLFDFKNLASPISSPVENRIKEMGSSIDQLIKKIRQLSLGMRPSIFKERGLEEVITCLVRDLKLRTGKLIKLEIALGGHDVDLEISTTIFRILQEALTNTLRHSLSERVDINLWKTVSGLTLTVRDYDDTAPISFQSIVNSLGLIGMKERASGLGGKFSISNVGGVMMKVEIPFRRDS